MQSRGVTAHRIRFLRTAWFRYAAAIIIILGLGIYFYTSNYNKPSANLSVKKIDVVPSKDIAPGGEKAVLTLADGSTIVLDSAANGELAMREIQ